MPYTPPGDGRPRHQATSCPPLPAAGAAGAETASTHFCRRASCTLLYKASAERVASRMTAASMGVSTYADCKMRVLQSMLPSP